MDLTLEQLIELNDQHIAGETPNPFQGEEDWGSSPFNDDEVDSETQEDNPEPTPPTPDIEDVEVADKTNEESISSPYQEYFNILQDNGALYTDEGFEFDGTAEGLEKALMQTKTNLPKVAAQALWQALPEDFKPLLEYAIQGGTDIKKYLGTFTSRDLEALELEGNAENQRYVLKTYFQTVNPKYTADKIDRMIDRLFISGEMESEAISAIEELKEIEKENRATLIEREEAARVEREEQDRQFRSDISNIVELSDIDAPRKSKLKNFMFSVSTVGNDSDTALSRVLKKIAANKNHYVQLADVLLDYDEEKGLSLDRIRRKETSKAVGTLKQRLEDIGSNAKTKVTGINSKVDQANFNWEEFLNQN